jgi:8-oxo-dGTP pyrophosphatase MutT (NUDIX family)
MKRLLTFDEDNYTQDMPVYERWNVRAVIFRDGKLAMERSRAGEYKFPGGSVDAGESRCDALCREVREEMGLVVLPSSIQPLGEILEKREDLFAVMKQLVPTYRDPVEVNRVVEETETEKEFSAANLSGLGEIS